MIVIEKMKNAVNHEECQLVIKFDTGFHGILEGCFRRNYNVTKDVRIDIPKFPFSEREG
jgi:hypothetical protein